MDHGSSNASMARNLGFDDFMAYDPKGGGGGGFLSGWKSNEEGKGGLGMVTVFLHKVTWATAFWLHNWPRLVEVEDKETKDKAMHVWGGRWGCHEREVINEKQNFRDKKTHEREYPPEVCPICRCVDWLATQYLTGKLKLTAPVFQFDGDDPSESMTLTVGGLFGRYGAKTLSVPEIREIKSARIDRTVSFKEDMRSKLKFLYLVVDAQDPSKGVQKAFEGEALTNAIKKAVGDTRTRLERKCNAKFANPVEYPYPFEWTYDDSKAFSAKFSVVALAEDSKAYEVPDDVMALISSDPPDISRDIEVGSCFELRGQMEAHLVPGFKLPWDYIFGPAKAAGLMEPPAESKADDDSAAEGEEAGAPGGDTQVVVIGPDHEAWTKGWNPAAAGFSRHNEVHTDAPEGFDDNERERIEKAIAATGATVGQLVTCDHCNEVITTLDADCGSCGARYDDVGTLLSRPCQKPECLGQCMLTEPGNATTGRGMICETCGTIHMALAGATHADPITWAIQPEEKVAAPAAKAPAARRRPAPVAAAGASLPKPGAPPFG